MKVVMTLRLQGTLLIPLLLIILYGCNSDPLDDVVLNGDQTITHEVNTVFTDPGITLQDGYQVITTNPVDDTLCGEYTIEYRVIDDEAILQKTLLRTVSVVDSTPPTLELNDDLVFEYGVHSLDDLITLVEDNYTETDDLIITSTLDDVNPTYQAGTYAVTVTATDEAGNTAEETIDLTVNDLDLFLAFTNYYQDHDAVKHFSITQLEGLSSAYIVFYDQTLLTVTTDNIVTISVEFPEDYDHTTVYIAVNNRAFTESYVVIHMSGQESFASGSVEDYNILETPLTPIETFDITDYYQIDPSDVDLASLINTHLPQAIETLEAIFNAIGLALQ